MFCVFIQYRKLYFNLSLCNLILRYRNTYYQNFNRIRGGILVKFFGSFLFADFVNFLILFTYKNLYFNKEVFLRYSMNDHSCRFNDETDKSSVCIFEDCNNVLGDLEQQLAEFDLM